MTNPETGPLKHAYVVGRLLPFRLKISGFVIHSSYWILSLGFPDQDFFAATQFVLNSPMVFLKLSSSVPLNALAAAS